MVDINEEVKQKEPIEEVKEEENINFAKPSGTLANRFQNQEQSQPKIDNTIAKIDNMIKKIRRTTSENNTNTEASNTSATIIDVAGQSYFQMNLLRRPGIMTTTSKMINYFAKTTHSRDHRK